MTGDRGGVDRAARDRVQRRRLVGEPDGAPALGADRSLGTASGQCLGDRAVHATVDEAGGLRERVAHADATAVVSAIAAQNAQ